jgi:DNA-directed RNA polymerase specialized sigma24 family protein
MTKERIMEIYDQYFTLVFCQINSLIDDPYRSMEMASDVFIALYRLKSEIFGESNIKCFLLVTARNMSLNYLKKFQHA